MTQYVGVIRKDMGLYTTPEGGVQFQRNLDSDKNKVKDLSADAFGQIGVKRQQKYFDSDEYEPATESGMMSSQYPETMAMRQAYEGARKRGVIGQQIGQGIGRGIGVLSGLVSLANAGAAGQDALTGAGQAYQTGEYMSDYASPRIGNLAGQIGAATASPVKVERQKTFDEAPMVASPTNTPAPTPAPVAVAPRQNLPSDPRQIFNTNYAGVKDIRQQANEFIGVNPYAQEGDYSAVNTSQENPFNPMMMHQPPDTASSPMTPMGTFQVNDAQGKPVHPPALQQQVAVAEPTTVPQTPSAGDVGKIIGGELDTTQQSSLPLPNPSDPTNAEKIIQSNQEVNKTISDALGKMEKAEILGRQAAYDDFVKMFVEVKS